MTGTINARPVWAGMAIRMADGTLFAVELDGDIEAVLNVDTLIEDDPTVFGTGFPFTRDRGIHVDVRLTGIGRKVARFGPDMGADHRPDAVEARKAIGGRDD